MYVSCMYVSCMSLVCIPFPIWNQSVGSYWNLTCSNCCFLTYIQDFSRGRSGGLVFPSLSECPTVYCHPHTQRLWHSQEIRNRCFFLELSCFFHNPMDVGNLNSGSSAFSKTSLNIWKFLVHRLLKPGLNNFEYYFTCV